MTNDLANVCLCELDQLRIVQTLQVSNRAPDCLTDPDYYKLSYALRKHKTLDVNQDHSSKRYDISSVTQLWS